MGRYSRDVNNNKLTRGCKLELFKKRKEVQDHKPWAVVLTSTFHILIRTVSSCEGKRGLVY